MTIQRSHSHARPRSPAAATSPLRRRCRAGGPGRSRRPRPTASFGSAPVQRIRKRWWTSVAPADDHRVDRAVLRRRQLDRPADRRLEDDRALDDVGDVDPGVDLRVLVALVGRGPRSGRSIDLALLVEDRRRRPSPSRPRGPRPPSRPATARSARCRRRTTIVRPVPVVAANAHPALVDEPSRDASARRIVSSRPRDVRGRPVAPRAGAPNQSNKPILERAVEATPRPACE